MLIKKFHKIYGMSMNTKVAKQRLEGFSEILLEHICKCILYRKYHLDYGHWKAEIATWIANASKMTIKTSRGKFKPKEYDSILFGQFGDSLLDCEINLDLVYSQLRRENPPYPEVAINDGYYLDFYEASVELREYFCTRLAEKSIMSKHDVLIKVSNILDKYCS